MTWTDTNRYMYCVEYGCIRVHAYFMHTVRVADVESALASSSSAMLNCSAVVKCEPLHFQTYSLYIQMTTLDISNWLKYRTKGKYTVDKCIMYIKMFWIYIFFLLFGSGVFLLYLHQATYNIQPQPHIPYSDSGTIFYTFF